MFYESVEFWVLSTIILVLLAVAGYFYQQSRDADRILISGIKESVDRLVESIKEHTAENTRLFEKGDERMSDIEKAHERELGEVKERLSIVETKCAINHNGSDVGHGGAGDV